MTYLPCDKILSLLCGAVRALALTLVAIACMSSCARHDDYISQRINPSAESLIDAYNQGQLHAKQNVADGLLMIIILGEYDVITNNMKELLDRYGIVVTKRSVRGLSLLDLRNMDGYNSISMAEIKRKYGNEPFEIIKQMAPVPIDVPMEKNR